MSPPNEPTQTAVRAATVGWKYDTVSIGYHGAVVHGRPISDKMTEVSEMGAHAAQQALYYRARCNRAVRLGEYRTEMENNVESRARYAKVVT